MTSPTHTVTLIPGDGVGPEVAAATKRLIAAAGVDIEWEEIAAGKVAFEATGDPLPQEAIDSIERNRVALKGRIATPVGTGYESPNVTLRKALNLFANVRPIHNLRGLEARYADVNLVVIRESTEDVYAGIEHEVVEGVVQSLKVTTRAACERVARFAFEYARRKGREKVTLVHKANIMKKSDGLFIEAATAIASEYPDIGFSTIIADNCCMQMVKWPWQFDVLVAQNLFGDLISDIGAGVVGGISAVYGCLRNDSDIHVFEAIHGLAEELEGTGQANPLTMIRPAIRLLVHIGEAEAGERIEAAVGDTLEAGIRTRDLGGEASTEAFVDAIISRLG